MNQLFQNKNKKKLARKELIILYFPVNSIVLEQKLLIFPLC